MLRCHGRTMNTINSASRIARYLFRVTGEICKSRAKDAIDKGELDLAKGYVLGHHGLLRHSDLAQLGKEVVERGPNGRTVFAIVGGKNEASLGNLPPTVSYIFFFLTSNGRTTEDITTTNGKDHIECTPRFLHGAVYRLVTVTGGWWPCYTLDDVEGAERGALV